MIDTGNHRGVLFAFFRLAACMFVVLSIINRHAKAQEFTDFQKNIRISALNSHNTDPLLQNSNSTINTSLFYKQQYNLFRDVNISEFSFTYSRNRSRFNIQALNDNTGQYISLNKFYGLYSIHIPILKDTYIASAISAGLINFSMGSTDQGGSFSDNTYDIKLGLSFHSETTFASAYYSQFLNQELQPYKDSYILQDEINIFFRQALSKESLFQYYAVSLIDLNPGIWNEYFVGGSTTYNKKITMGGCLSNMGNANIDFSVNIDFKEKFSASFHSAYEFQTGFFNGRGNVATIQFGIIVKK